MNTTQRGFTLALIALGILLVGFFGMRAFHAYKRIHEGGYGPGKPPPAMESDVEMIRDWMTIPYIAQMYGVPPRMLFEALEIPEKGNRDKSLQELNLEYFPDAPGSVLEKVKAAVSAGQPPVLPAPPSAPAP